MGSVGDTTSHPHTPHPSIPKASTVSLRLSPGSAIFCRGFWRYLNPHNIETSPSPPPKEAVNKPVLQIGKLRLRLGKEL